VKAELDTTGLHFQLSRGYCDPSAGVAFFNNCGWMNSRRFELGDLQPSDFEEAMRARAVTIFGIEDCQLRFASQVPSGPGIVNVVLLRDPLNNVASRLEGAKKRPAVFRTDEAYVDMLASYCAEFLDRTAVFGEKVVISFNRFVGDRDYRDSIAAQLGVTNVDVIDEVSDFGGGSSFTPGGGPSSEAALMTRFRDHPIPPDLLELLLDRPAIQEVCAAVFGYDLAELAAGA
jgi:hypothetical protein